MTRQRPRGQHDLPTGVVTFLLTDIEGSTQQWERHGSSMAAALLRHDQLVAASVTASGGRVIKSKGEGDSTVSVFGRASDAIAAAEALRTNLGAEHWPGGIAVRVRMAVHTGESHERDGDYFGPTLNRAARLRGIAVGGQVVLSEATASLVVDHLPPGCALADLGRHELRGLTREERVYELRRDDAGRGAAPPAEVGAHGELPFPSGLHVGRPQRFIGRAIELAALRSSWEAAQGGPWRSVLIGGEPGIGKSRLVGEFATELHAAGATVLFGTCDEDLRVPYQPFAEALRALVAGCSQSLLEEHVGRFGGDLARLVPDLARRVPRAPAPLQAEPESERYRLLEAAVGLLHEAAEQRPVLLVLDDLQWATKPTLLLLRHVIRGMGSSSLLLVAMYRHTELSPALAELLADLRPAEHVQRLALAGLDEPGVVQLLEALGGATLDEKGRAFARRLFIETAGSPFFVREVVSHLRETGAIRQEDGGWTSDLPSESVELPASVREVIRRRLGRLSDPARRLLAAASVMGVSFQLPVLESAEQLGGDGFLDAVDEAMSAGVIREVRGTASYAFTHGLLRQAVYEDLSALRRARLHRRVAEALETRPGYAPDRATELATHYLAAAADGTTDKAVEYAIAAASEANARVAHEEAVRFCEQALEVLQWAGRAETSEACDLVLLMADSQWRAGDMVPSRETYASAADLARRLRDGERLAAAALRNNADLSGHARSGRVDHALISLLEDALDAIGPADSDLRARLLARLGLELFYSPDMGRRLALSEQAVEMAERLGDPRVLLFTRNCREWATLGTDLQARLAGATEVLRLAEDLGDLEVAYQARYARNLVYLEAGDFDAADAEAAAGQLVADELRQPAMLPWVASYRSLRTWVSGRIAEAQALNEEGMAQALARPLDPDLVFAHFGGQAMLYLYLRPGIETVVPIIENMASQEGSAAAFEFARCLAYSLVGEHGKAGAVLDDILARGLHDTPKDALWLSNVPMLGLACRHVRDRQQAARILYDLLEPYADRWVSAPVITWGPTARVLGVLAGVMGHFDVAERHLVGALDAAGRVPAPLFEADIAYDLAVVLLERDMHGDRARAAELLDRSRRIAEELELPTLRDWVLAAQV